MPEILSKITVTSDKYIIALTLFDLQMRDHDGQTLADELKHRQQNPDKTVMNAQGIHHVDFPRDLFELIHIEAFFAQYGVRLREVVQ